DGVITSSSDRQESFNRVAFFEVVAADMREAINDAPEVFDALDEITDAYVLVRPVRVRAGVSDAEGDDGRGRQVHAADRADRATRRIERIDNRRLAVNLRRGFNRRPRDGRSAGRLSEWGARDLYDLYVVKLACVQMCAQEFDDQFGREIGHEPKIQPRARHARQHSFSARFGVACVYAADGTGRAEDQLFRQSTPAHVAHPAADLELTFEARFVHFDLFEHLRVRLFDGRNMRVEAVNRNHAFGRDDGGERLHEPPSGIGHDAAPL